MRVQGPSRGTVEITEGSTRMLVPRGSLEGRDPPLRPAFFNPRAEMNRSVSVAACSAFARRFGGPKVFVDCMASLGARGLRVANEAAGVEEVVINDLNPSARELARRSAALNGLGNVRVTGEEACRLCSGFSRRGERASMVDIDPFGSPARFVDCGIRATMHGGILSATATDLQVLSGRFQNACRRRYGGAPVRTEYGNETAIRLVLGCIRHVAARMDVTVAPLFVESDMHYYRIFVRVLNRPDQGDNVGYIAHCAACADRWVEGGPRAACRSCGSEAGLSGPLWTGDLFDGRFVGEMASEAESLGAGRRCKKLLAAAALEAGMPAAYYTLDEIASRMGASPVGLADAVERLRGAGFAASPTSLNPAAFRTDAPVGEITAAFGG